MVSMCALMRGVGHGPCLCVHWPCMSLVGAEHVHWRLGHNSLRQGTTPGYLPHAQWMLPTHTTGVDGAERMRGWTGMEEERWGCGMVCKF